MAQDQQPGRRASDHSLITRAMQAARVELHGALLPVLIALIAYLGNEKINRIEARLEAVQQNTTDLAVIADRATSSSGRLATVEQRADENARVSERVITTLREHARRLDRLEERFDRD